VSLRAEARGRPRSAGSICNRPVHFVLFAGRHIAWVAIAGTVLCRVPGDAVVQCNPAGKSKFYFRGGCTGPFCLSLLCLPFFFGDVLQLLIYLFFGFLLCSLQGTVLRSGLLQVFHTLAFRSPCCWKPAGCFCLILSKLC